MEPNKKRYIFDLPLFLTLSAVVGVYFLFSHITVLARVGGKAVSALRPLLLGVAAAFILYPSQKAAEGILTRKKPRKGARTISSILVVLLAVAVVALFVALVIPQLTDSISSLVRTLPEMYNTLVETIDERLPADNELVDALMKALNSIGDTALNWVKTNLFSTVSTFMSTVKDVGSALISIIVAMIITIYLLMDRERYGAQCKKAFLAVSKNEKFNQAVFDGLRQTNTVFTGFITGKLLDSLIVGIICFICLVMMGMPYATLISVIVGVTNIIPMFGPFLGAVPGLFLLLMISPRKALIFLIFIVILQQVDGNIIGPRILGDSTGLSPLYVIIAILLFGKLMGFFGMVIGVPLFAVLYYIVKRLTEYSLNKRGLPSKTEDYM